MNRCPFSEKSFLRPPAAARLALHDDFMPGVHGENFREQVRADFPETATATIDAIELQRHLVPVITKTLQTLTTADPEKFSEAYCPGAGSLFDVRRGVQHGMLDIAEQNYDDRYPPGSDNRAYHDALTDRYLEVAKQSRGLRSITALHRMKDGIATAVHVPFKFFEAIEYETGGQGTIQEYQAGAEAGRPDTIDIAKSSWRVVQAISQLELSSYDFLTERLFTPAGTGNAHIYSHRFNRGSKWLKLLQYNTERARYEIDLRPQALGRNAIDLSTEDKQAWEKIKQTGAERLRCPMTRLPEEVTEDYVHFLVNTIMASGVWQAPKPSVMQ